MEKSENVLIFLWGIMDGVELQRSGHSLVCVINNSTQTSTVEIINNDR